MTPKFHSGHANIAFDQIIRLAEARLCARLNSRLGFSAEVIRRRVVQRLVELTFRPFAADCIKQLAVGRDPLVTQEQLNGGGVRIDRLTGEFRLSAWFVLRSLVVLAAHSLLVIRSIISHVGTPHDRRPATFVMGLGRQNVDIDGSDERFVRFCDHGPIEPLRNAERLVVQSTDTTPSTNPKKIQYSRACVLSAVGQAHFNVTQRTVLAIQHVIFIIRFLACAIHEPVFLLLARDAAYVPAVKYLDRAGLIKAVVLTNADYEAQPLWLRATPNRKFKTHMVWYAQNTIPPVFRSDGIASDLPNYRHLAVDVHWVWTRGYADYLDRLGIRAETKVVGSILWYLPDTPQVRSDRELRIAAFDVTPVRDEVAEQLGLVHNYYRTEHMIQFLEGMMSICRELKKLTGLPVRLKLKHKRNHTSIHDPRYIEAIQRCCDAPGDITFELTSHQSNVYSMIQAVDLVVVVPYSSPAIVASEVGVPAIFFDPTGELLPVFERASLIHFASGTKELLKVAEVAIQQRATALRARSAAPVTS